MLVQSLHTTPLITGLNDTWYSRDLFKLPERYSTTTKSHGVGKRGVRHDFKPCPQYLLKSKIKSKISMIVFHRDFSKLNYIKDCVI